MISLDRSTSRHALDMILRDNEAAQLAMGMGMRSPLSFEDVLCVLLMKYASKRERDILDKVNEIFNSVASFFHLLVSNISADTFNVLT